MSDKIMTLHPEPTKQGVNIDRNKYQTIHDAIISTLERRGPLTYTKLTGEVEQQLKDSFDGSVGWYTVTVKLDLEARGKIERIPSTGPEQVRLVDA